MFSVAAIAVPAGLVYFLLFIVVSAVFTLGASVMRLATAWPLWTLYVVVTTATLVCFRGFLRGEFDYVVR